MDDHQNIALSVSSDNPSLNLFNEFVDSFNGDIPNSAFVDIFDENSDYTLELQKKSGKYLGETIYYLLTEDIGDKQNIQNEISTGTNLFNPFTTIPNGSSVSIPLSSTNLSATAGPTLDSADVIWQFVDNRLEGAWYKRFDEEFLEEDACIQINSGSFDMKFPYADRGLSGDDLDWTGMGVSNCNRSVYTNLEDSSVLNSVEELYWETDNSLSSVESVSLNETTLIRDGAYADKNIFKADQIQVKPNRESTEEQFAWLYDFDHTELPISCGNNQLYWPLVGYTEATREFPYKIQPDQVEDIRLADIPITKSMSGATAGLTPETSDKIFKKSGFCESGIEGAWLKGCDVSSISEDITPLASIQEICDETTAYIDGDDHLSLSASCGSTASEEEFSIESEVEYSNLVKSNNDLVPNGNVLEFKQWQSRSGAVVPSPSSYTGDVSVLTYNPNPKVSTFNEFVNIGSLEFTNNHDNKDLESPGTPDEVTIELVLDVGGVEAKIPIDLEIEFDRTINTELSEQSWRERVGTQCPGYCPDWRVYNTQATITLKNTSETVEFEVRGDTYTAQLKLSGEVNGEEILKVNGGLSNTFWLEPILYNRADIDTQETKSTNLLIKVSGNSSLGNTGPKSVQLMEIDALSGYDYSVEKDGCVITVNAEQTEGENNVISNQYSLSTDGIDFIYLTDGDGIRTQYTSTPLINCFRKKVKSINGTSRQSSLSFMAPAGEDTPFIWEFPDSDATEVINGYDHDDYCDYSKLNSYESILNSKIGDEANQWKKCNCKAVYYSPIGNDILGIEGFDNYKNYSDIIYLDTGVEPFSYSTWIDEEGNDYRTSDQFAVFKYTGDEPDVGYGIGYWETLSGKPLILKQGRSYIYRRASFGDCDENRPPCFVVRNTHCYDSCSDETCKPVWTRLVQNENEEWVDTGEVSDMVLESGQFYEYEKIGSSSYTIYKGSQEYTRTTPRPSFPLNVSFNEALPYWASSPTKTALNVGTDVVETTDYLLTTQPEASEIVINNNDYFNYVRNSCDPFVWIQPLKFTVDFQKPNTWKRLDFNYTSPNLLQKIVGCGGCELHFENTPDQCFLKSNFCNSYIGEITATDVDSDMVIKTPNNCGTQTEIYYYAQNDLTWNDEVSLETPNFILSADEYVSAPMPWKNYLNGNESIIKTKENDTHLKSKKQTGVFTPNNLGVTKIQCFGRERSLN